ncbi:MAG: substrate-binding domain-containing protein [Sulfolobales archaeon]
MGATNHIPESPRGDRGNAPGASAGLYPGEPGMIYYRIESEEVCEAIASGKADVGLTLRYTAEKHGLRWIHVAWEEYECYALRDRVWKAGVEELRRLMSPQVVMGLAEIMPGYRVRS